MPHYPKNVVREYLDKNPDGTYSDFVKKTGCRMVSSNFSYIRRRYMDEKTGKVPAPQTTATGKRPYIRRKSPLQVYSRVWFHSTENLPKEAKDLVRNLVQELNVSKRTNWEVVELTDPKEIEIREHTKS